MKTKLWIGWGVVGATALIALATGHRDMAFMLAFVAAGMGWIAFFVYH